MQPALTVHGLSKNWVNQVDLSPQFKKEVERLDPLDVNKSIDIYNIGKIEGAQAQNRAIIDIHTNNIKKASEIAEFVLTEINKLFKLKCSRIYLKTEVFGSYDILLMIDPKRFISKERLESYKYLWEKEKENNNNHFKIAFSYIPKKKNIDEYLLTCDGFTLKYEKK